MELTDREKDLLQALSGTTKSALSIIPGLGQAIAGWEAYRRSNFERNLKNIITHLENKIDDLSSFFSRDWLKTEEGEQFARKVFDSAFDAQLEDKQELFINALVNGVNDEKTSSIEKLKFVDMLRHLSRASLMILAEMHKVFQDKIREHRLHPDLIEAYRFVDPSEIAKLLSKKFHPYLVTASISEMESQGLFSGTSEWREFPGRGNYIEMRSFGTGSCYSDFTARFIEFISVKEPKRITTS